MKKRLIFNMVAIACLLLLGLVFLLLMKGVAQPQVEGNSSSEVTTLSGTVGQVTDTTAGSTATEATKPTTAPSTEPATTTPSQPVASQPTEPKPTEPAVTEPKPTEPTPTVPQQTTPPPEDLPPSVVIPPEDEEKGLSFPCQVPGYDLVIEKLAPYSGLYVEDGTNAQCTDVAMILVRNNGSEAVEYAQIVVQFESTQLQFRISALPGGESAVVQEFTAATIPEEKALEASVLVVQRSEMSFAPEVSVKDNGDNSITIENLTDKEIPSLRIFYKYYMEDEGLYVGGIAFTAKITLLPAGGKMVIRPSHFISQTGRVVMTQVYDTEG